MDVVKFPGFDLEFNISKYAIQLGSISIYKYAVCIVLGIIVGIILSKLSKEKFGINYDFVIEILIGSIIFGLIGARLYYIVFNLERYINNPLKIFAFRDGGLAIYGAIIAIVIYLLIICKIKKVNFLDLADYLVPYLALGQSIGRWGNFFNKEAYGNSTNSIFRMGLNTANRIHRSSSSIFIWIYCYIYNFFNIKKTSKKQEV